MIIVNVPVLLFDIALLMIVLAVAIGLAIGAAAIEDWMDQRAFDRMFTEATFK